MEPKLVSAAGATSLRLKSFADVIASPALPSWARGRLVVAADLKLIEGNAPGKFGAARLLRFLRAS